MKLRLTKGPAFKGYKKKILSNNFHDNFVIPFMKGNCNETVNHFNTILIYISVILQTGLLYNDLWL